MRFAGMGCSSYHLADALLSTLTQPPTANNRSEAYLLLQGFVALLHGTQLPCPLLQAELSRVLLCALGSEQRLQLCTQQYRAGQAR